MQTYARRALWRLILMASMHRGRQDGCRRLCPFRLKRPVDKNLIAKRHISPIRVPPKSDYDVLLSSDKPRARGSSISELWVTRCSGTHPARQTRITLIIRLPRSVNAPSSYLQGSCMSLRCKQLAEQLANSVVFPICQLVKKVRNDGKGCSLDVSTCDPPSPSLMSDGDE